MFNFLIIILIIVIIFVKFVLTIICNFTQQMCTNRCINRMVMEERLKGMKAIETVEDCEKVKEYVDDSDYCCGSYDKSYSSPWQG